jgi:hypothetical protein
MAGIMNISYVTGAGPEQQLDLYIPSRRVVGGLCSWSGIGLFEDPAVEPMIIKFLHTHLH